MNVQEWIRYLYDPLVLMGFCVIVAARMIGPIIEKKLKSVPTHQSFNLWKLLVSRATIIILTFGILLIAGGIVLRWHDTRRSREQALVQVKATLDEQVFNEASLSNCRSIVEHMLKTVDQIGKARKTNSSLLKLVFPEATSDKHPTIIGCRQQVQSMMDQAKRAGVLTNTIQLEKLAKIKASIKDVLSHTEEQARFVCDELATKWEVAGTSYQIAKLALTELGIPNLSSLTEEQSRVRQSYRGFHEFYPQWLRALRSVVDSDGLDVNSLSEFHWQNGRLLNLANAIAKDHSGIAFKSLEVQKTLKSYLSEIDKGSSTHAKAGVGASQNIE